MIDTTVKKLTQAATRQRLRAELLEQVNAQSAVTRCADCRWYVRGTVGAGKSAYRSHRELKHS
jgi:hypothetical protein